MSSKNVGDKVVQAPDYYRTNSWNRLAWGYDALMRLALFPFGGESKARRKFMDFAQVQKGGKVLDICAGTGSLTVMLADKIGPGGTVIGIDLSVSMLDIARRKTESRWVSYRQANSENLPFESNIFDSVFVFLGLHEMPEKARISTLKEAFRVIKPGGHFFIVDHALPRYWVMRLMFKSIVKLTEDKAAYKMLINNSLIDEIENSGFALESQASLSGGTLQMFRACKKS